MTDTYRHLIGGETSGRRHEAGDVVASSTPPRKIKEWLDAKIIKREKVKSDPDKPKQRSGPSERRSPSG